MKKLTLLVMLFATIASGCSNHQEKVTGGYDSMHFVRQGGGQIDFSVFPTDHPNEVRVVVASYNFRDTTLQFTLNTSAEYATTFIDFHKALDNQHPISGDATQPTLPTGTWAHIYLVADSAETEVTHITLRNSLLKFEPLTRSLIGE